MESQNEQENTGMNDGSVVQGGLEAAWLWLPEHKLETLAQPRAGQQLCLSLPKGP